MLLVADRQGQETGRGPESSNPPERLAVKREVAGSLDQTCRRRGTDEVSDRPETSPTPGGSTT